jgi:hypothetical protein
MKKKIVLSLFLIFQFLFSNSFATLLNLPTNELTPLETKLLTDLKNGKLDTLSLYDVVLIVSGLNVENEIYRDFKKKIERIKKDFLKYYKKQKKEASNNKETVLLSSEDKTFNDEIYKKANQLLIFLHDNYFKVYDKKTNSIINLFISGKYNCLSSTILYTVIANDLGLNVKGVVIPEHTFAILINDSENKDVETTMKTGFDIDESQILNQGEKNIPEKAIDAYYSDRQIVEPIELISLLYTNYIKNISDEALYTKETLKKYIKAMEISPNSKILKDDLNEYLLGYAMKEFEKGNISFAIEFLNDCKKISKDNQELYSNALIIFTQSIQNNIDALDLKQAKTNYEEYSNFIETPEIKNLFIENIKNISINKINSLITSQADIEIMKSIANFALSIGTNELLDIQLNEFLLEANKIEKEINERKVLNDLVMIFNEGKYDEVLSIIDDIINNSSITIPVYINEINNFKNSAKKIKLYNELLNDVNTGNTTSITRERIEEIKELNKNTGNNEQINEQLETIKKEFIKTPAKKSSSARK